MKNTPNPYWILALILTLPFTSIASPVYLTFEGTVTYTNNAPEYFIGQSVRHVFLYDLERDGEATRNGVVETEIDDATWDFFYVEYVEGDALKHDAPVNPLNPTQSYSYNYGRTYLPTPTSTISASNFEHSGIDQIWINGGVNGSISNWAVGQTFSISNRSYGVPNSDVGATVRLSLISDQNPMVPEPGSMALFGCGLFFLSAFVRATRKTLRKVQEKS